MNKVLKNILLAVLVLAVLSNAYVHFNEIFETRVNTMVIDVSNKFMVDTFEQHFGWIMDLYVKHKEPNFGELMNATVVVYNKDDRSGAGVCIKEDEKYYYILSAQHVVIPRHKNNVISIRLLDGIICAGEVIKEDIEMDLSLIRITKSTGLNLSIVEISKNNPQVGEVVYALGHPMILKYAFTKGIISNTSYPNLTMSNITIAYGNSGGGLFNIKGELLGINTKVLHYHLTVGRDEKDREIQVLAPVFSLSAAIKLEIIKEFLKEE